MRTKYGSTAQYNYNIQEEVVNDNETSIGKKADPKIISRDFRDTQNNVTI